MRRNYFLILFLLGMPSWAAADVFTWKPIFVPLADPIYSGNWSNSNHWNIGTTIPSNPNDAAGFDLVNVHDYTVRMDLDTHIGTFILDSPTAILEGVGRVFRVDGANDFLQGTVNWESGQILDSGAGTLTNKATVNVSRTVLFDMATFEQKGTLNVATNGNNTHLTLASDITLNHKLIDVSTATGSTVTLKMTSGTLVNEPDVGFGVGTLRFSGAGSGERRFEGDLNNSGFVQVKSDTRFTGIGDVVTNSGSILIDPNATMKMQANGQVFHQNGNELGVLGAFEAYGLTFNFNAGSVGPNSLSLVNSELNIGAAAKDGKFVLQGSANNYSGSLKPWNTVTVLADTSSTTVNAANGFNNDGTLKIESTGTGQAFLSVRNSPLVNLPAGVLDFDGTTGLRRFDGDLTNFGGTVTVHGDTVFGKFAGTVTNTGSFTIAPGATFTSGINQIWNQDAGILDVQGTFTPQYLTLNYNGGQITGSPITVAQGSLNFGPGAGDGSFELFNNVSFSGDVKTGQQVTVRGDNHNAHTTVSSGLSNSGIFKIESYNNTSSRLDVNGGPLVNQAAGTITFSGAATKELRAELTNKGAVNVDDDALIGTTGTIHLNSGEIIASASARFLGISLTNQSGGVIRGDGELNVASILFSNYGEIAPGTSIGDLLITGDATFGSTSSLSIELGGTNLGTEYDQLSVSGMVTLDGTLAVELVDSFVPMAADTFTVLSATTLSGALANVADGARLNVTNGAGSFLVSYDGVSSEVVLSDFLDTLVGDFDSDSDIDGFDFLELQRGFGTIYYKEDLADWKANYGPVVSLAASLTSVPEPSSLALIVVGLVGLGIRRRKLAPNAS